MKYTISYILMFCLIFTLFTACGQAPETPTDAIVSVVESVVNKEVAVNENSAVVSQDQEETQPVSSKTSTLSTSSKVSVASTPSITSSKPVVSQTPVASTPAKNTDGLVADAKVEYPSFTKESALKEWLLGNHADYFADKRGDMLSAMGNKETVVYYKPSIPANHSQFILKQINVHTPSSAMHYLYNGNDVLSAELTINVTTGSTAKFDSGFEEIYKDIKGVYEKTSNHYGEEVSGYCYQQNGIEFFCSYDAVQQYWWIVWKQFDLYHYSTLHGHFDQIEEIIPLLYLQQVKVDNSAVIK